MKKFLLALSVIIFAFLFAGMLFSEAENKFIANGVAISVLLTSFVWMPVFLFYAYDRRQLKKEALEKEEQFENDED